MAIQHRQPRSTVAVIAHLDGCRYRAPITLHFAGYSVAEARADVNKVVRSARFLGANSPWLLVAWVMA
jgi:hypothetical protein